MVLLMHSHTLEINIPEPCDDLAQKIVDTVATEIPEDRTDPFWITVVAVNSPYQLCKLEQDLLDKLKASFSCWRVADLHSVGRAEESQVDILILFNTLSLDDILTL